MTEFGSYLRTQTIRKLLRWGWELQLPVWCYLHFILPSTKDIAENSSPSTVNKFLYSWWFLMVHNGFKGKYFSTFLRVSLTLDCHWLEVRNVRRFIRLPKYFQLHLCASTPVYLYSYCFSMVYVRITYSNHSYRKEMKYCTFFLRLAACTNTMSTIPSKVLDQSYKFNHFDWWNAFLC